MAQADGVPTVLAGYCQSLSIRPHHRGNDADFSSLRPAIRGEFYFMENAITAGLEPPQKADILIVDDTIQNLVFLAEVLESQGYRVRKARNGGTGPAGGCHRRP